MSDFSAEPAHQVNGTTAGDQVNAVVSELSGGGHVVAWTSGGFTNPVAMAQVYDAGGAAIGPELTLAEGFTLGGIAGLGDGTFVASLTQNFSGPDHYPRSAVYYARFDASGRALGAPVLVDGDGTYDIARKAGPVLALPGGGFAVDDTSVSHPTPVSTVTHSLRVFDATGTFVQAIGIGENYIDKIADAMSGGGFIFADDPYTGPGPSRPSWHVVDAQGNATAGAELQSVYGQVNYSSIAITALANGGAVAVWDAAQYANGQYVPHWQAQLIDASGHAAGGAFDWNFSGGGARLTALPNGGFIATWLSQAAYGTTFELHAQTFDASAHATSGDEDLGTLGTNTQSYDMSYSVTATSDGGFIVDYQSKGDGQDIFEQKFDAVPASSGGGTPIGPGTIALSGAHTQYTVSSGSITGPEGTIPLAGIDRIQFADHFDLAFDVNGDAGEAYRLYQAAFDRAPDLPGLGYQINDLDRGVPLWLVAQHFIDSPEFQATYGATDNTQFITLLYQNVLHRGPDTGGLQFHLDEFAHGESRADMLIHFSESPENQANVIGQIGNGMLYVPIG